MSVVWAGVGEGVRAGAGASLRPHVYNEVLTKRNPKNQKEPRTKNEHEKKSRYFLGIRCVRGTFWAVSSIGGTFWAMSSVGGTFWAVSTVGGSLWVVSRVGGTFWTVSRVGGTFWRYLELAVLFWRTRQNQNKAVFFRQ